MALAVEKKQILNEPLFCPRHILRVKITMEKEVDGGATSLYCKQYLKKPAIYGRINKKERRRCSYA